MEALNIAFDTVIVGALALPWVLIVVDLMFWWNGHELQWKGGGLSWTLRTDGGASQAGEHPAEQNAPIGEPEPRAAYFNTLSAAVSVLLFAVAFLLGSAVSRNAKDFFNDDDLPLFRHITEDAIRANTYCQVDQWPVVEIRTDFKDDFGSHHPGPSPNQLGEECTKLNNAPKFAWWKVGHSFRRYYQTPDEIINATKQVFQLQESAVLLAGEEKTERLRQLHNQITVLEGAALNALIAFFLCGFCWLGMKGRRVRYLALIAAAAFLGEWIFSLSSHLADNRIDEPPFMEFTLIILGAAGIYILLKRAPVRWWYGTGFVLSLLFFGMAFFGWWWTEVVYTQQVNFAFYAHSHNLLRQIPSSP
jgi:hypothetical protein